MRRRPEVIRWLMERPELLDVDRETLGFLLKEAGLYRPTTKWQDIKPEKLVQTVRTMLRQS